jgi:tripartite ATP-independent transporter DctM subunit
MAKDHITMRLREVIRFLDRIASLTRVVNSIGAIIFFLIVCITFADVFLRYFFHRPISGGIEITEEALVILVMFGLAYTQREKGHITIDIVVNILSRKLQTILRTLTCAFSIILFSLVCWRSMTYAAYLSNVGETTTMLGLPVAPFVFVTSFGSALLVLLLIRDLLENLVLGMSLLLPFCILILCIAIPLVLAGIFLWAQPVFDVSPSTVGIIGVLLLLLLLVAGMPVSFALALVGFLGLSFLAGKEGGLSAIGSILYDTGARYDFSVIPFFVLMGMISFIVGLSRDLYDSAYSWVGSLPGGLGITTVAACTVFGAISGETTSTAVTMGTVSLPEMKRHKYDLGMSTGCVAAGGTLAALIPPSLSLIIYGLLADQSIGELFISGIFPGMLLAVLYSLYIYARCRYNPDFGPPGPRTSLRQKISSLKNTWAVLVLFVLIIGGIYAGAFTPTEAGAIGSVGALLIGLCLGRLQFHDLNTALLATAKTTTMIMLILAGAGIFGYFVAVSGLPVALANFVTGFDLPPMLILIAILATYLVIGCFTPAIPAIILTLPVFLPIIVGLDFDLIWFGVLIVLMMDVALITPPVGMNVFAIKGVARDVPLATIFRGVIPFVLAALVCIATIVAFPKVATFLPNYLHQ